LATISSGLGFFLGILGILQRLKSLLQGGPLFRGQTKFADRNQNTHGVLDGTVETTGSSGPVSPTIAPYPPSTDLASRRPLTTTSAYAATAVGAR
jgi:hypothetical protein